jgi:UDP-N-acetylmuramate dehydrogenase
VTKPDDRETDPQLLRLLRAGVRGEVRADEPLAAYTTLRVGGAASALVRAESAADLAHVARVCARLQRPWLILGRGSNLLVADDGWPGVVVLLGRAFRGVEVLPAGRDPAELPVGTAVRVRAGAAEPMPVLAARLARLGLGGLAFGVAIPGSLGGAVRMNAGAHGGEMRDVLQHAEVVRLDREGACERIPAAALAMAYRHSRLPADAVVVAAELRLERADDSTLAADMAEMKRWRREHQPINEPSCGSVFRNPDGDSAGRLIDSAGMKGHRVGGAAVSRVHANFITVSPGASATDVAAVIRAVRERVAAVHGVRLRTEVVLAGFEKEVEA